MGGQDGFFRCTKSMHEIECPPVLLQALLLSAPWRHPCFTGRIALPFHR